MSGGGGGSGPLPMTNANEPRVSWPSTAETAFHATVYPPSPSAVRPTLSVVESTAVSAPLSTRLPPTSSTSISDSFGSGLSLKVTRTSVGARWSLASESGTLLT